MPRTRRWRWRGSCGRHMAMAREPRKWRLRSSAAQGDVRGARGPRKDGVSPDALRTQLWRSCSNEGQSVYLYAYISHTLTHMYTRISTYILSICLSVYLLSIYVLAFFGGCVASEGRESVCERVSGRKRERERCWETGRIRVAEEKEEGRLFRG